MALVYYRQEVLGEIVKQTERPHSGLTAVEIPAVVFNAGAVSHLAHHLYVVGHAFFQSVRLQLAGFVEKEVHLVTEVKLYLRQARGHSFS